MLKKYKNQIFKKIEELGYDVSLFEFTTILGQTLVYNGSKHESKHIDALILKNTIYMFIFYANTVDETTFRFSFNSLKTKNIKHTISAFPKENFIEFDKILDNSFLEWLNEMKDYLNGLKEPDLWELAKQQNNVLGASLQLADYQTNTEYFTPQEQNLFTLALKEFERKLIAEYQPSAEVLEKIQAQMLDIQADLKKLSKKSWFDKFIEQYLPNILVSLALSSEARATLAWLFEQSFITVANILMNTGNLLSQLPIF